MKDKDYVSYEVAKAIQSKTKHYFATQYFYLNGVFVDINDYTPRKTDEVIQAPHLYDAQKWLRETYNINIKVMPRFFEDKNNYGYDLYLGTEWDCTHSHIGSYEEALNEGIKQALIYI